MFERPVYYQPPYHGNAYYGHPYSQQYVYPQNPSNNQVFFQTPFEQFEKPKQPANWYTHMQPNPSYNPMQSMNSGNNLFSYFKDQEGHVDIEKMFSTVGQIANTVQQVSPVVKQVGSIMKSFR